VIEAQNVPNEPPGEIGAGIIKAVELLQFEGPEVGLGGKDTTTAGTEINREIHLFFHGYYLQTGGGAGRWALRSRAGDD
jgi:hypothetical protein